MVCSEHTIVDSRAKAGPRVVCLQGLTLTHRPSTFSNCEPSAVLMRPKLCTWCVCSAILSLFDWTVCPEDCTSQLVSLDNRGVGIKKPFTLRASCVQGTTSFSLLDL